MEALQSVPKERFINELNDSLILNVQSDDSFSIQYPSFLIQYPSF